MISLFRLTSGKPTVGLTLKCRRIWEINFIQLSNFHHLVGHSGRLCFTNSDGNKYKSGKLSSDEN